MITKRITSQSLLSFTNTRLDAKEDRSAASTEEATRDPSALLNRFRVELGETSVARILERTPELNRTASAEVGSDGATAGASSTSFTLGVRITDGGKVGVGVNVGRESSGYTHGQGLGSTSGTNGVFYTPGEGLTFDKINFDYSARDGITSSSSSTNLSLPAGVDPNALPLDPLAGDPPTSSLLPQSQHAPDGIDGGSGGLTTEEQLAEFQKNIETLQRGLDALQETLEKQIADEQRKLEDDPLIEPIDLDESIGGFEPSSGAPSGGSGGGGGDGSGGNGTSGGGGSQGDIGTGGGAPPPDDGGGEEGFEDPSSSGGATLPFGVRNPRAPISSTGREDPNAPVTPKRPGRGGGGSPVASSHDDGKDTASVVARARGGQLKQTVELSERPHIAPRVRTRG